MAPHEDEIYDDAPSAYRRGGLATALALIGCALLGTAGAYAYRSYSGMPVPRSRRRSSLRTISTPTKVVPRARRRHALEQADQRALRQRGSGNEQLVSRQEEPVAVKEPGTAATPARRACRHRCNRPSGPAPPAQSAAPVQPAPPAAAHAGAGRRAEEGAHRDDPAGWHRLRAAGRSVRAYRARRLRRRAQPHRARRRRRARAAAGRSRSIRSRERSQHQPHRARRPRPRPREPFGNPSASRRLRGAALVAEDRERGARDLPRHAGQVPQSSLATASRSSGAPISAPRAWSIAPMSDRSQSAQEAQQFCANYKAAGGQCIVPTQLMAAA